MKQISIYKGDRALYRARERAAYEASSSSRCSIRRASARSAIASAAPASWRWRATGWTSRAWSPFTADSTPVRSPMEPPSRQKCSPSAARTIPYEKPEDMKAFEQQLRDNNVDYQIVAYGHAVHAFTDPDVDALNQPGAKYNAAADKRSWQAMRDFFAEIFAK